MKILLVSDDIKFVETLKEKLVFLRRDDQVIISDYADVYKNIDGVNVVLIHQCEADDVLFETIKKLRNNKELCLLFVPNSNDSNMILTVSDLGIDDFVPADARDFEFVIRIVNNIKYNSLKNILKLNTKLLNDEGIIEEYSQFYKYEYCKRIIENYISDFNLKFGTFMVITLKDKVYFSIENVSGYIKSSLRSCDTAFLAKGANFYVFLPETDFSGAICVFNKIKANIDIKAGLSDISGKSFDEFEQDAINALSDAITKDVDYVFAQCKEETLNEWLSDTKEGNYKLFRKVFNKKLEKVIAPVFYRLQKAYEEKLFQTKIEQYTNDEQCVFKLKNQSGESLLRIVYPGFAKIMIYILHDGLDSPENREISLQLDKVTQKELVCIVEDFIKEFKETRCYW